MYGVALGFVMAPVLPEMIATSKRLYPEIDEGILVSHCSSLFAIASGLGTAAGPWLGTSIYKSQSQEESLAKIYPKTTNIIVYIFIGLSIIYFLWGGVFL